MERASPLRAGDMDGDVERPRGDTVFIIVRLDEMVVTVLAQVQTYMSSEQ